MWSIRAHLILRKKSKKATVTPFEKLDLSLNGNQVSGEVKYAEKDTKYVLRTYFAEKEGGADYLIDEQICDRFRLHFRHCFPTAVHARPRASTM